MGFLRDKLARLREVAYVVGAHSGDVRSCGTLLSCYAAILRSVSDPREVALRIRIASRRYPVRMRRSDVFTLAEVVYERQYELASTLPEGPIIVDAGANVGFASLWLDAHHPGARLFAFEPEPSNFLLLEHNLGPLEKATAEAAALGREDGQLELVLGEHAAVHSTHDDSLRGERVRVPCRALAPWMEEHELPRIDLLKLDVEGAEADVVAGLGPRLEDVGVIVGELHERLVDEDAFYETLERAGLRRVRKQRFPGAAEAGVHVFEAARAERHRTRHTE